MRKAIAFFVGLITWSGAFLVLQSIGFMAWDMEPGAIASELVIGFFSSLISLSIAEFFVKKLTPEVEVKNVMLAVGLTVIAIYICLLFIDKNPKYGYAPLISGLTASILPFLKLTFRKRT